MKDLIKIAIVAYPMETEGCSEKYRRVDFTILTDAFVSRMINEVNVVIRFNADMMKDYGYLSSNLVHIRGHRSLYNCTRSTRQHSIGLGCQGSPTSRAFHGSSTGDSYKQLLFEKFDKILEKFVASLKRRKIIGKESEIVCKGLDCVDREVKLFTVRGDYHDNIRSFMRPNEVPITIADVEQEAIEVQAVQEA